MKIDIKITIEEPENPALAGTPETEAADRKEEAAKTALDSALYRREIADLTTARVALTQQMIKAENEANNLADENWELTQRVEELVAELAESEMRALKFEKHNLALQSANTALRTRTLKTRTEATDA